jgi:hypothetical protein
MDGLEPQHEPDVAIVVEDWAQARLAALRATAEDLVAQFWAQAARERGRRPRKEWGRLGVRVRLQRAPRSQPGAFSIEWFVCRWANRQGDATVKTAYIRRGAELRYSRAAFRGVAQPWEIDLAEAMEDHFVLIRRLVQSLSALRVQLRQHLRLEQRLGGTGAQEGA